MFSDELTAQRKRLVITAQHCLSCPRRAVLFLIKVIRASEQNLFVDLEQTGKHVDCAPSIKQLSVTSRTAA